MNYTLTAPLSPEEQQEILAQLPLLMARQVQSYHKQRHMGDNSSIPTELAQELLESIDYTLDQVGGIYTHRHLAQGLALGQEVLREKLRKARALLDLVSGTAPGWQTDCRWEALGCLRQYLDRYDPLHLAHKGPEGLFYPILIAPPENLRGIDECLFYLNILWIENQIMAGIPEEDLSQLWDRLPADTLNQCEQLLLNSMGKLLLSEKLSPLVFRIEEYSPLIRTLSSATEDALRTAAAQLCQALGLQDEHAKTYAKAILPQLRLWAEAGVNEGNCGRLFV